jgi:enediyne biosynthesis protein E5
MSTDFRPDRSRRLPALRRFAVAITVLNVLGHTFFGFEQSWAQLVAAVFTAYFMEILTELLNAWASQRPPRFGKSVIDVVDFLLSAHITGLAVAMLIYANEQIWPFVFGTAVAMASKTALRAPVGYGTRHFLNPSNFGITITLLLFPWVSVAPPYHFTENLSGWWQWVLPGFIVAAGTFLNGRYTHRLPLIGAWVGGFALQEILRSLISGAPFGSAIMPMTSVMFVLFTFYMVTDPATTPDGAWGQVAFGAGVAAAYGVMAWMHLWLALFFPLAFVCLVRGAYLYAQYCLPRLVAVRRGLGVAEGVDLAGGTIQHAPLARVFRYLRRPIAPQVTRERTGSVLPVPQGSVRDEAEVGQPTSA